MLQAYTNDASGVLFGEAPVTVEQANVTGINVEMAPGVEVSGTVESAGEVGYLHLRALRNARSRLPPYAGADVSAEMGPDGTFTLKPLWPGRYEIVTFGSGDRYVTSATSGSVDVLSDGLTVGTANPPPLKVSLGQGAGTVRAKVAGLAVGESATVVAVRRYGTAVQPTRLWPEREGMFFASGLAPGDYSLYAWGAAREVEYRNPAVLEALSAYALSVSLPTSGALDVAVKLIPKDSN